MLPRHVLARRLVAFALFATFAASQALAASQTLTVLAGNIRTGVNENTLMTSFLIEGTSVKTVLVQAAGPALTGLGFTGDALADPFLSLHGPDGSVIATNDDWLSSAAMDNAVAAAGATVFAPGSKDAALLVTLSPGVYVARVSGVGATNAAKIGVARVGVYDLDGGSRIAYFGGRARIAPSAAADEAPSSVVDVGFAVENSNTQVLLRAVGASLPFAAVDRVNNPRVTVYQIPAAPLPPVPQQIAFNENSSGGPLVLAATAQAGLLPITNANDSAQLLTLAPGNYTLRIEGNPAAVPPNAGLVQYDIAQIDGDRATQFAPALLAPLIARGIAQGENHTFGAVAIGRPFPAFQWYKDGQLLPGKTAASLTISGVQPSDAGEYSVQLQSTAGTTHSAGAQLTVGVAITAQPASQTVEAGDAVSFEVTATGSSPLYQWRKDGVAIAGATASTFSLASASMSDAGIYDVVVHNSVNSITSTPATLSVVDTTPPEITQLTASPDVLTAPDHKMVLVTLTAVVSDNGDASPTTQIIAVTSNEPGNGQGDGNTAVDWVISGPLTLELRAERSGKGSDRVYTITVESRDSSGNASTGSVTVSVPKGR